MTPYGNMNNGTRVEADQYYEAMMSQVWAWLFSYNA